MTENKKPYFVVNLENEDSEYDWKLSRIANNRVVDICKMYCETEPTPDNWIGKMESDIQLLKQTIVEYEKSV